MAGSIAVIADVRRAAELDGRFGDDRVQVLEALDAKGLEFDAVLIVGPEDIVAAAPTGMRTLYVALTRATQRLTVLTAEAGWQAFLDGEDPQGGDLVVPGDPPATLF